MRSRLLILGGFAHDAQGVLAAVEQSALVFVKLCRHVQFPIGQAGFELRVASFAHANGRRRFSLYDQQASGRHDRSLAHPSRSRYACGNQTAPVSTPASS